MKKEKKKFKDWGVTKFIKKNAPQLAGEILDIAGDLSGVSVLGKIADKIKGSTELSESQKEIAKELMQMDIAEMEEVTKRWESDNLSDSFLAKNVRPLVLMYLVFVVSIFAILDAVSSSITFAEAWITLFSSLLLTTVVAYFGSRGAEKWKKIK